MAKHTPHGDHTMGALFAPSYHRPWLRYIDPVDGAEAGTPPEQKPETDPTDWKAEARKWEARAKENATKARTNEGAAQRLQEIEDANRSELEKANARADAAERRAAEAEARSLRADVAAEKKVPVELLSGSTREELEAAADKLIEFKGPERTDPQTPPAPTPQRYVIPDEAGVPALGKQEHIAPGVGTLRAAYAQASNEGK